MEQFVLIPASVYNKSMTTQSVTMQELPKYQPPQNPTYQIDSGKKEINKILFSKADTLVNKLLSCPRIKLSTSQLLVLDDFEFGILLSDFAQQLRRKNADIPDIYFMTFYLTPLVYIPLWFWLRMPKLKRDEARSLSKSERRKLWRLYTQGDAAYGSVCNLVKDSSRSVSKVR